MSKIAHRDVMQIQANPARIREFVMTPERIADYFPAFIDHGVLEQGQSFWVSGKSGVSLFERIDADCTDSQVTISVITSNSVTPPYTLEAIKNSPMMSMVEDWDCTEKDGGTQLTKTWRDVVMHKMKWLPMTLIIRLTAKGERKKLVEAWGKAAGA